jgi:hypothetical protein
MKIHVFWDVIPCNLVEEEVKIQYSNLKMEAAGSSETLATITTKRTVISSSSKVC